MPDVRHALRQLARRPVFTAVVVLTLALGIGANTAIFSVANALFLRPLPYRDAGRLVEVLEAQPSGAAMPVDYPNFLAWRSVRSFESAAIFQSRTLNLTGSGPAEQLAGAYVSATFLSTLGVVPAIGRDFTAQEDRRRAALVAILSHTLWQDRFGGDPGIVGRSLRIDGKTVTVVGVLPRHFRFYRPADVFVPIEAAAEEMLFRNGVRDGTVGIARLRAGVEPAAAAAELETSYRSLELSSAESNRDVHAALTGLRERIVGHTRTAVMALLGAVGLLLLIACVNVANLLLARAVERRREMAVRVALGAGRARVARQLLVESLLLSSAGAVVGVGLAAASLDILGAYVPADLSLTGLAIDGRVLGLTIVVSALAAVLSSLAPTVEASRVGLTDGLRDGAHSASLERRRLRKALVVGEVALAVVLLAGAGLLIRSFANVLDVDPGIDGRNALTARVSLPLEKYGTPERYVGFWNRTFDRVRAIPGVEAAGLTTSLPLSGSHQSTGFLISGRPLADDQLRPAGWHAVSPGFFRAAGIPLVKGRTLDESDTATSAPVAVISRSLARRYFADEDPIGRQIHMGPLSLSTPWMTVVGVVGDTRQFALETAPEPEYYFSALQLAPWTTNTVVVRTTGDPLAIVPALRAALGEVDSELPLAAVRPLEDYVRGAIAPRRSSMLLVGLFSAAALLLTTIGVCGVVANSVAARTREIGMRVALGARNLDVLRLVVGQAMRLVLAGTGLGLAGSLGVARLTGSMLYGVEPGDPLALGGAAALLAVTAFVASFVSARPALRVDPITALRQ
jgi:putative ABC transport system permease protein